MSKEKKEEICLNDLSSALCDAYDIKDRLRAYDIKDKPKDADEWAKVKEKKHLLEK